MSDDHDFNAEDVIQRYPDTYGRPMLRRWWQRNSFTGIPTAYKCDEMGEKHHLRVQTLLSFFSKDVIFRCTKCPEKRLYDRNQLKIVLTAPRWP